MPLYSQISVAFSPHQGNIFLQQMETITEKHNQPNFRVVEPSPNEYIYKTIAAPKL